MKRINITDITLKVISQDREANLLFREKTAIASCADSLGVDAVELAPITSLREDTIIYKTIAQNISNSVIAIPAGFSDEEIENAWECVKEAAKPRLQIDVPVSTALMEYTYHIKSDKMLDKIGALTSAAKKLCEDVEFVARDATRTETEFIVQAAKKAEESGAGIITICDDAGVALPEEIADIVTALKGAVKVPVYVQVSDKIGMSAAAAVAAIKAGADGLKSSMVSGKTLALGEISDAITTRGDAIDVEIGIKSTSVHTSIDDLLGKINQQAYETEISANENEKILLDSDSTISQVMQAAQTLGYDLTDEDCGKVHKALLHVCEKKNSVGKKEFEALVASYAMQAPSTYHLESYTASCGNTSNAMAQVTLKCDDELLTGVSIGDGPIDAAFRAIEQCIGYHYELDNFHIQAVTEGKGALGSALVRLRNNGKLYSGNGISTDIVAASIRAYINALNKIVFEEE